MSICHEFEILTHRFWLLKSVLGHFVLGLLPTHISLHNPSRKETSTSFILIIEHIDGVTMSGLSEDPKSVVRTEVEQHLATLRGIKSDTIGSPSGIVLPPYRVMRLSDKNAWPRKVSKDSKYVFCHNDLSQHNIIVDPQTLKIQAIMDWEYAGFFPEHFEWPFYERRGPSIALDGEHDDSVDLLQKAFPSI